MVYLMRTLILLSFLLDVALSYSMGIHWGTESMVIRNGLNNNTVYNICHGRDGFIWLSTDRGISRYDGFRFRNYPLIMQVDSLSVPMPQAVGAMRETPEGLFYARLYQGGIVCFDKEKEIYLPFCFDRPFNMRDVLDFCWCGDVLYLGTTHGLFQANVVPMTVDKKDFMFCSLSAEPLVEGRVTNVCTDWKSNLYISINRTKLIRYNTVSQKESFIQEYNIINRLFFQNGYLWIGRMWNDIVCYDLKNNKERIIPIGNIDNVDFSCPYITDLTCRDKTTFYLTTWDGLFRLEFETEDLCESSFNLVPLTQNEVAWQSNVERKMTSVHWDGKQDILWVSTFGGGIVKYDVSDSMYSRVRQEFNSRVNGIVEDKKGYIWLVMTDGMVMKSTKPSLSQTTRFELWKKSSGFSGHFHIHLDKNGTIWLGNNLGEVFAIDPLTEEMKTFHLKTEEGERLTTPVHQLCVDSRNRLWVGTSDGLIQVDTESFECRIVEPENESLGIVYSVVEDKEGNMWIGTNKGLKRLQYLGNQLQWKGNYEQNNALEESAVRTIYVNNSNQIYVVYLNMVLLIDGRNKDKLETIYTLEKGLTNGHISCMVDDQMGNTWAGNNSGIITIRNGQEAFYNYLTVGNCSEVCRLADGRLIWANSWGLIYFDPTTFKIKNGARRLLLTDIEVDGSVILAGEERNGKIILPMAPEKIKKLVLSTKNNDFRLYLSDLRYGMAQRKVAYRLLPEEKKWKTQLLGECLWYSKLQAGEYSLEAKLVFPDGTEGCVTQLPVIVEARWFRSVWAYCAYGLLIMALACMIYFHFKKRNILKQIHRDREMLLREALNVEKIKQNQKQEIETMRNRLLMLFVQKLRTPLSLIIGPLKDMLGEWSLVPGLAERGKVAYRNSLRMLDA